MSIDVEFSARRSGKTTRAVELVKSTPGAVLVTASTDEAKRVIREHELTPQQVVPARPDTLHHLRGRVRQAVVDDIDRLTVREIQMIADASKLAAENIKAFATRLAHIGGQPFALEDWQADLVTSYGANAAAARDVFRAADRLYGRWDDPWNEVIAFLRHELESRGFDNVRVETWRDPPRSHTVVALVGERYGTAYKVQGHLSDRELMRGNVPVLSRFVQNLLAKFEHHANKARRIERLDAVDVAVNAVGFDRADVVRARLEVTGPDEIALEVLLANDCEPEFTLSFDEVLPTHRLGDLIMGDDSWVRERATILRGTIPAIRFGG